MRPKRLNEEDVDAVWIDKSHGVIFLQMTVNENKKRINGERISSILERLDRRYAELWFVVPERQAAKFAMPEVRQKRGVEVKKRVAYLPAEAERE